jgi:hypothetical protein
LTPLSVSVFMKKTAQDEDYVRNAHHAYRRRQRHIVAVGVGFSGYSRGQSLKQNQKAICRATNTSI